ncbi:MAG: hypothetical protein PHF67_03830 [Candidatus Nanoarchaeia archaeon]|nr:hypothetical protein [Candidatus Nanoarchaeia archaeon]
MNYERKFKLLLIVLLIIFIIGFFIEYYYFNNEFPLTIFGVLILIIMLISLEIYLRIQHNIDRKFKKVLDLINSKVNINADFFNMKNDFEKKILNFRYESMNKLEDINDSIRSIKRRNLKN